MQNKTHITSDNIATFAKVQNAAGFADRGEIILVWDELDREQKKLAKNIEIDDIKIRTSDPRSVPDKWTDNIVEEDADPEAVDFTKHLVANPSRYDVYEMLKDYDPPEPLMLWWVDKCFSDPDYFVVLAEACRYGLFRGDNKYLWAAMAFGVDAGEGKFRWPSSGENEVEKAVKQKILDEYDIHEKELDLLWDDIKMLVDEWVELSPEQAEVLGIDPVKTDQVGGDDEEEAGDESASLLDL